METTTKLCPKCGQNKPTSAFYPNRKRRCLQTYCIECNKQRNKQHFQQYKGRRYSLAKKHRMELKQKLDEYRRSHPCVDCGETDPIVLDFDHVGVKSFNISRAIAGAFAWSRIEAELVQCEVRCANCHRRATYNRVMAGKPNGKWKQ